MNGRLTSILAVFGTLVWSAANATAVAPHVNMSLGALPIVDSHPFDSSMDAKATVENALARAKSDQKRVLIDLGANWCAGCIVLDNVLRLPEVSSFVASHYEVVHVDVGRLNRNLDVPARFGVTEVESVPAVLIIDADGRLLNPTQISALEDARSMTPQAIVDWLAAWAG